MIQAVRIWMRDQGGLALLAGGMALYLVLLVLDLSVGWRLPYPWSIAWVGIVAIPAAGVALLYLQTCDDSDEDGHIDGERR